YLESIRDKNITADLAFYAYRDMTRCDWRPFVKAAMERCPVSIEKYCEESIDQIYSQLKALPNESIYEGPRLAQPDEVANYNTGDGIEKAFTLANVLLSQDEQCSLKLTIDGPLIVLKGKNEYRFPSTKGLKKQLRINTGNYEIVGE
ncbi:MAG: hypothetical protein ACYSUG_06530, partial [Planctomycetota bacterium]